jgi:hypothetical protein
MTNQPRERSVRAGLQSFSRPYATNVNEGIAMNYKLITAQIAAAVTKVT